MQFYIVPPIGEFVAQCLKKKKYSFIEANANNVKKNPRSIENILNRKDNRYYWQLDEKCRKTQS